MRAADPHCIELPALTAGGRCGHPWYESDEILPSLGGVAASKPVHNFKFGAATSCYVNVVAEGDFLLYEGGMFRRSPCLGISLGLCALAFAGACSKTADKGSPGPVATTTAAPAVAPNVAPTAAVAPAAMATTGCRGTMSGAASGPMTCEPWALFFLAPYKESLVRG